MVSENILVRSRESYRNKEKRRSYMFVGVIEISVNLLFIKSKNNHRIDKRHCMLHLHTHATLYSACRLVVPSGNENMYT